MARSSLWAKSLPLLGVLLAIVLAALAFALWLDGREVAGSDALVGRAMTLTQAARSDARAAMTGDAVRISALEGSRSRVEEAIAAANGTPYGLSSAIYTRDAKAMLRFKEEIGAGMTSINNSTTGAEAHLPFGGNGWSGNGTRESGIWVLDAYTRWQAVNVDLSGKLQKAQIDLADAPLGSVPDYDDLLPSGTR